MYKYFFIIFSFIFVGCISLPTTAIDTHKFFANGFNNIIEFSSKKEIAEARLYFKDSKSPLYQLYVKMNCNTKHCYAKLPLATADLLFLDYVILHKSNTGKLSKSKIQFMRKRDLLELPQWQKKYQNEKVVLYSELNDMPTRVRGFGNKLKIKPTINQDIWGIQAKLYKKEELDNTFTPKPEEEPLLEIITNRIKSKLGL